MNIILFGFLYIAALWDYHCGKIPNKLILLGITIGYYSFFMFLYQQSLLFILSHIFFAIIVPFLLLYPLFIIGALGAADIKIFFVMALFLTLDDFWYCMIVSFYIGAIFSLIKMISCKILKKQIYSFLIYFYQLLRTNQVKPYQGQITIPFTIPIFLSYIIYLWRCI
ncbi:MAG: prepilin peptidase [Lachnospiraceae bacterium]